MRFSKRTAWDANENDLAVVLRARRAAGLEVVDLTVSNPTTCGFTYAESEILSSLSNAQAMTYAADPLGMISARLGVAKYYYDAGAQVNVDRICLTTGTSEAYSFLFRLLCDPGDEVLIARPSYPLFDFVATLDDVVLREYPLAYDPNADDRSDWSIDMDGLRRAVTARTRAVIVVHPNNPTGNFVAKAERYELVSLCAEKGIALIVDEVFLDYAFGEGKPSFTVGEPTCQVFVVSGISKLCGLPQMKASWIVACGQPLQTEAAMRRIEIIADTYLSMSAPVQLALPKWLEHRHSIQLQILKRMEANRFILDTHLVGTSAQRLKSQAGWTAILRVPRTVDGQEFADAALNCGVLVQPGMSYGMPQGRAIISLITPQDIWGRGLSLLPISG